MPALLAAIAAAALALPAARPALAASPEIKEVRHASHSDYTRVVIELTSATKYKVSTRTNPYRIVVDIPGGGLALPGRDFPVGDRFVNRIRLNRLKHGAQVVLDLPRKSRYAHFALGPSVQPRLPLRIVVDVGPGAPGKASEHEAGLGSADRAPAAEAPPGVEPSSAMAPPPGGQSLPDSLRSGAPGDQRDRAAARERASQGKVVVVIDAGHGGTDPGAMGPRRLPEEEVTLRVARALQRSLESQPDIVARLTRHKDQTLSLARRQELVEEYGGDLLVSIHVNSSPNRKTRGVEIFTLSLEASAKEAAQSAVGMARRFHRAGRPPEEATGGAGGHGSWESESDLPRILSDLQHVEGMMLSGRLAAATARELDRMGRVKVHKVRQAGFQVLKLDGVPGMLVEIGFFSNREEARVLADSRYAEEVAAHLAKAVTSFVREELRVRPSVARRDILRGAG